MKSIIKNFINNVTVIALSLVVMVGLSVSAFAASNDLEQHSGVVNICEECGEIFTECPYCQTLYHSSQPHCPNIEEDLKTTKVELLILVIVGLIGVGTLAFYFFTSKFNIPMMVFAIIFILIVGCSWNISVQEIKEIENVIALT